VRLAAWSPVAVEQASPAGIAIASLMMEACEPTAKMLVKFGWPVIL
jgi:hypothetical protein